MASSILQPFADRFKVILEGLSLPATIKLPPSGWQRDHLPKAPGAEIELPDIGRGDSEQPESQLGANDWTLEFLVTLWFDLREATVAQKRLAEAIELWIKAIDSETVLYSTFPGLDAMKVTRAERVYQLEKDRTLVGYETTVACVLLVP